MISCRLEGHWRKWQDLDPDPIPLVTGTGQNVMDPQRYPQLLSKYSKKNLKSFCFVTFLWLFYI